MTSHAARGKAFQLRCRDALERTFGCEFELEVPIHIGGIRPHAFDLANETRGIIAECKAFTFTSSGNNPSAKITTLREAAGYLRSVPGTVTRILMMKRDEHPVRRETLGHYFVRLNCHHLERISVAELPENGGAFEFIYEPSDRRG